MEARTVHSLDGEGWTLDGAPVTVPHTWNAVDGADGRSDGQKPSVMPGFFEGNSLSAQSYVRKLATYGRSLPAPTPGRRYFLNFDGVSQKAAVRVNGRLLCRHVGAFTPFCCEITSVLSSEGNWLEVDVDNRFDPDVPPTNGDYTLQGGIYRPVTLIETPQRGIDPSRPLRLWPDASTGRVRAEIPVLGGADETRTYEVKDHRLWSPEEPNLYPIAIRVGEDEVVEHVGFKTTEMRPDGFYLNGKKYFVRGVSRHQDVAHFGWAVPAAQEEADVKLMKALGANAVRLAHYPQSRHMYELCDRYGLLVWSEAPIVNILGLSENFLANALSQTREMVTWRGNHVSIAWWSVFNEVYHGGVSKPGTFEPIVRKVRDEIRRWDPVRLTIAASNRADKPELNLVPEALGMNAYPSWYGSNGMKAELQRFLARNPSVTTLCVSEYGGGASTLRHANPLPNRVRTNGPWHPEEYQTRIHHNDYRDLNADPRVWGCFVWQMFDTPSDVRSEGDAPGINDKGLVRRDHVTLKDSYQFYRANWTTQPMLHLCSKRMDATTNAVMDVVAFSNAKAPVRLRLNGCVVSEKTPDEVATVVFPAVALRKGPNEIAVDCGACTDRSVLHLKD